MAPPNWNTGEQIREHKLAASIINGHGTSNDVLDDSELALLQRFCTDPSVATRDRMIADNDWFDGDGRRRGDKAAGKGSLAGFCISRYGTDDPAFDERDLEMLKGWFERGMPVGEGVAR